MINCLDERNINLPLFNFCGDHDADKELLGEQEITMISFNIERLSYYPTYGQRLFDSDLGKLLICIDPGNKVWVDSMGNKV